MRRLYRYDHRKNYGIKIQLGLICSLLIFIAVFKAEFKSEPPVAISLEMPEEVIMEEIVQTRQIDTPPPPPRPPVPIEVPNDEILEDEIINLDSELNLDDALALPPPPPAQDEDFDDQIFVVVENPPVLIGGISGIQKRIKYPEMARVAGVEGRVIIQFVVSKEGNIINPKVIRGIGAGCDEEALRALKEAKFKPGLQRGIPVNVTYAVPITFTLSAS